MTLRGASRRGLVRERGNTFLGLVIGVVLGLGIAAIVAVFVSRATIPFVNKVARTPTPTDPDSNGKLPDPNRGLYSKDTGPAPLPGTGAPVASAGVPVSPTVVAPPPPNVAPGADGKAPVVDQSTPDSRITMLQAGAFSSTDDAESMRGKLALLGFDSRVMPGDRDGAHIFRVRLGPYTRIEDLNRARQRLIENGVEATLVAPGR